MLRDSTLIPLSRQHHNGLALGVLSRRSLKEDSSPENVARVAQGVVDHYELELANHFEIEEQVLFPLCEESQIVADLVREHRAMAAMVQELRAGSATETLERYFSVLTAHIRREERELFERIQQTVSREALDQAGREIERRITRVCLPGSR